MPLAPLRRFLQRRRRTRRQRAWWDARLQWLPPADHRLWPILRLLVLVGFMYHNASNFDMTEGKTIIAVAIMEALGIRSRKA